MGTAFKDYLGYELAKTYAKVISASFPAFPQSAFLKRIKTELEPLELKDRVRLFARALRESLPADYPTALEILLQSLPPENGNRSEHLLGGDFALMPVAYFVEVYGLDNYELSMQAIREITKRHTAEFTIRPFLERYPQETLAKFHKWITDPNPHIRRLISEGSRPRLPWASKLTTFIEDPSPCLPFLQSLRNDPTLYVRKSVANHLNDIAKDHPRLVIDLLNEWQKEPTPENQWITRHALRGLIKAGNPDALALIGVKSAHVSKAEMSLINKTVLFGEALSFSVNLAIKGTASQMLVLDYAITFAGKSSKPRRKVFKWKTFSLKPNETVSLTKSHAFKAVTVRTYYPGRHQIEIIINGKTCAQTDFVLIIPS